MSAAGSILALILFAAKQLLTKLKPGVFSQAAQYWGWKVVLLAFLMPFPLLFHAPIHTPITAGQNIIEEIIAPNYERFEKSTEVDYDLIAEDVGQLDAPHFPWWVDYLRFFPLIVSAVLFGTTWRKYRRFSRALRLARDLPQLEEYEILQRLSRGKKAPSVYRNPLAPTAMLTGVLHPTIYLPDCGYSETQLENILLHELTHYRRRDVLVKWCAVWLTQLHWFNPLAYLVRRELDRACELSCDAEAIRDFNDQKKQDYGDTLIFVAAETRSPCSAVSATMCVEKWALKERLTAIMNSKRTSRPALAFSAVLVMLTLCMAVLLGMSMAPAAIDPASVTAASMSFVSHSSSAEEISYDELALSDADINTLLSAVNSHRKTYYWNGYLPPFGTWRDSLDTWVRFDRADGGFYILHYWYANSFSINPLHYGEDDYWSLLTRFDAEGHSQITWKLDYSFDYAFGRWLNGGILRAVAKP